MNKNKAKIVISILGFIFIFLYICDYKEELITKAINTGGDVVNFNIHGEDENVPEFKIVINKSKKIINVTDRKGGNLLNKYLGNKQYFSITVYDKNDGEKYSTTLLGDETGFSSKLNGLDNYAYEYGDYLKFFIDDEEKMKLSGDIKGLRSFYLRLEDLKFNLTQEGIKVDDTAKGVAYNIQFSNAFLKIGESFDPLKNIIVTNEYDEDYMSNVKVRGNVDTNVPGKYVIEYVVVDKGYVSIPTKRTITVINELSKEAIRKMENMDGIYEELRIKDHKYYFRSIDRSINKFIIKFNRDGSVNKDGTRRTKRAN